MARWQSGTAERMIRAATELYLERGYDGTSVADIAERAGVTERTFFRHFTDKREVLFAGTAQFRAGFLDAIAVAPEGTPLPALVDAALESPAAFFPADRWQHARSRADLIEAHPALRERELLKMADLGVDLTAALAARGIASETAAVAAEATVAMFRVAFARWIARPEPGAISPYLAAARAALGALVAR